MTPRTASLRVAHQRTCANATKTAIDSLTGCTCKPGPSYYTLHRDRTGRAVKGSRVTDKRVAQRSLDKIKVELAEGRVGMARERNIAFSEWADEFDRITEQRVKTGDLKPGTLRAYRETLGRARTTIGHANVRDIGAPELRRFDDSLTGMTVASRARHLKQLAACLAAAVDDGYAETNPVSVFKRKLKLRVPKRGKAPFEDGELPRLWSAMRALKHEPVYVFCARFSVETGARLGELIAADWTDVDLTGKRFRVEHTWNVIDGMLAPKDHEPRTIYLTEQALTVLQEWVAVVGVQEAGPLFPHPVSGGRLNSRQFARRFTAAMVKAGIPKLHPELKLPRSFHSLRYTTSNLLQRRGHHPRFIEQMLGHGSLELSYGVYGGWTPDQLADEAARVTTE